MDSNLPTAARGLVVPAHHGFDSVSDRKHPLSHSPRSSVFQRAGAKSKPALRLFSHLVRKELHLQKSSFLLLTGVVFFWCILLVLSAYRQQKVGGYQVSEILLAVHAFGILSSLILILPLLIGAECIAGERKLGVLDWQLALPTSRRLQLAFKVAVVGALAALCGGVVAPALDAIIPLSHTLDEQFRGVWPGIYSMLFSAMGLYISAQSREPYRAFLVSFGLVGFTLLLFRLPDPNGILWPHAAGALNGPIPHTSYIYLRIALLALLLVSFALPALRPHGLRPRTSALHAVCWAIAVFGTTLAGIYAERRLPYEVAPTFIAGNNYRSGVGSERLDPRATQDPRIVEVQQRFLLAKLPSAAVEPRYPYMTKSDRRSRDPATGRDTIVCAGHVWQEVVTTATTPELTLLSGEGETWDTITRLRKKNEAFFESALYRTPANDLVFNYQMMLVKCNVARASVSTYPTAVGTLQDWGPGGEGYYVGTGVGTRSLVGRYPFITQVENEDKQGWPILEPIRKMDPNDIRLLMVARGGAQEFATWPEAPALTMDTNFLIASPVGNSRTLYVAFGTARPPLATAGSNTSFLLYIDSKTRIAHLLSTSKTMLAFCHSRDDRWIAKSGYFWGGEDADSQIIELNPKGEKTAKVWTLNKQIDVPAKDRFDFEKWPTQSSRVSLSNWHFGGVDSPIRESQLGPDRGELVISPDGKWLAYAKTLSEKLDAGGITQVPNFPRWIEMHLLNLETGEDKLLGGFPPSKAFAQQAAGMMASGYDNQNWQDTLRQRASPTTMLSGHFAYSVMPPTVWSQDGRLAVLQEENLFLFDPNAPTKEGQLAPQFKRLDVNRCLATNLDFWDKDTLILWGPKSIWRLRLNTVSRAGTAKGSSIATELNQGRGRKGAV